MSEDEFRARFESGPWFYYDMEQRTIANEVASFFIRMINEAKQAFPETKYNGLSDEYEVDGEEVLKWFQKWFGE
jgi:hypothetical protein